MDISFRLGPADQRLRPPGGRRDFGGAAPQRGRPVLLRNRAPARPVQPRAPGDRAADHRGGGADDRGAVSRRPGHRPVRRGLASRGRRDRGRPGHPQVQPALHRPGQRGRTGQGLRAAASTGSTWSRSSAPAASTSSSWGGHPMAVGVSLRQGPCWSLPGAVCGGGPRPAGGAIAEPGLEIAAWLDARADPRGADGRTRSAPSLRPGQPGAGLRAARRRLPQRARRSSRSSTSASRRGRQRRKLHGVAWKMADRLPPTGAARLRGGAQLELFQRAEAPTAGTDRLAPVRGLSRRPVRGSPSPSHERDHQRHHDADAPDRARPRRERLLPDPRHGVDDRQRPDGHEHRAGGSSPGSSARFPAAPSSSPVHRGGAGPEPDRLLPPVSRAHPPVQARGGRIGRLPEGDLSVAEGSVAFEIAFQQRARRLVLRRRGLHPAAGDRTGHRVAGPLRERS